MPDLIEQRHGAVAVLKLQGPLVLDDAEGLRERGLSHVRPMLGRIAIDMADAPYIDSVGLEALLDLADEMDRLGQVLRLAGVSQTVREVLDLTGLTRRFEFYDDTNLAVRSYL